MKISHTEQGDGCNIIVDIEVDHERLNMDIETINKCTIDILNNHINDLTKIKTKDLYFSKDEVIQKRLTKVSSELFDIIKTNIHNGLTKKIRNIFSDILYTIPYEEVQLYRKMGIAFDNLFKICAGNLLCDSNDNPFKDLYEKHIESVRRELNFK